VSSDDGDDVVGQGADRRARPAWSRSWRLTRGGLILATLTLAVGLGAGYTAGYLHPRTTGTAGNGKADNGKAVAQSPRDSASVAPLTAVTPALTQNVGACSVQSGRDLQLGIQVSNQSAAQVTIDQIKVVLPLGGLRAIAEQWGPCGALPAQDVPANVLAPGASTWFSVTLKVLRGCPGPLPVQFAVTYESNGQSAAVTLPGFPDLGQVAYSGCPGS
jgi:hypothetical protein